MSKKNFAIIPLGTISPYPKGQKNCPGFLVLYDDQKILLDCGNGITRLLKFPEDLNNLHVFISHLHKDHYGDLGSIQYASYVYNSNVNIYLPVYYNKAIDFDAIESTSEACATYNYIRDDAKYSIGDMDITFRDNKSHTVPSYMMKLESDWFKVVYTSDVGNGNIHDIVDFAKEADLLIAESSLTVSQGVVCNTHLHAYEAATIAAQARVKKLMLTHFWPETKPKLYLQEAKQVFKNVCLAKEGKKLVLRRKR